MTTPVGWYLPVRARKAHLFGTDRVSLCRKHMALGVVTFDYDVAMSSPDNCAACWKRYLKTDHAKESGYV